jgi:hypothetical protein
MKRGSNHGRKFTMGELYPTITDEEIEFMVRYSDLPRPPKQMPLRGLRIIIPGFEEFQFVVHGSLSWSERLKRMGISCGTFTVSEAITGMRITFERCRTEEEAVRSAQKCLKDLSMTPEIMRRSIKHALKQQQEESNAA